MHVIYVDDEKPALDNFRLTSADFAEISELHLFQDGYAALQFAEKATVDAAFLDIEMPEICGLSLAKKLRELDSNTRIIFVTAYSRYALDAWSADATGYLLKPYTASDIHKELAKCIWHRLPSQQVVIETMPTLSVLVNGIPLHISGIKVREMLALLVDCGEHGFSAGEGIARLWPERSNDPGTQSLLRMTYKRLADTLEKAGAGHILDSRENRRFLKMDEVDCDLYRILAGDRQAARKYHGQYLQEYSWAEERNSQLYWMLIQREHVE